MASLQLRGKSYACVFCWHGKRKWFTVGKVTGAEAEAKAAQVEYLLMRLKQGLIELPPGVDIVEFVRHDGRPPASLDEIPVTAGLTVAAFRDRYLETHRESLEDRTVEGIELHFKHLVATLGERFPIRELKLSDLQGYVDRRARAKGTGGKRLSPATICKEIVTLRTAWNWGARMGLVAGRFPYAGLRYPKGDERPPFQTREEIRRQVAAGGLRPEQIKELWHALYLQAHEVAGLLAHAREHAVHPWIYPFLATAAHTGARRSELIRMGVGDVDLAGGTITVRERKRVRGKRSTRRAADAALEGGARGMAGLPPRRPGAILPCWGRRAEQEAEPDDRPSQRRPPGDDASRQAGDGAPASGGAGTRAAHAQGVPRPFQADPAGQRLGSREGAARPPALVHLLPGGGGRRPTDHRRHRRALLGGDAPALSPPDARAQEPGGDLGVQRRRPSAWSGGRTGHAPR
jgi:site-specific recombinase XerD